MKIVYNPTQFGLHLTEAEMKMIAAINGWTLRERGDKRLPFDSSNTWFNEMDWDLFRTHPMLIDLVENDALTNKNLRILELPDDAIFEIDTDWQDYEQIITFSKEEWDELVELSAEEEFMERSFFEDEEATNG